MVSARLFAGLEDSGSCVSEVITGQVERLDLSMAAERLQRDTVQRENRTLGVSGSHVKVIFGHQRMLFSRIEDTLKDVFAIRIDSYPGTLSGGNLQHEAACRLRRNARRSRLCGGGRSCAA